MSKQAQLLWSNHYYFSKLSKIGKSFSGEKKDKNHTHIIHLPQQTAAVISNMTVNIKFSFISFDLCIT